MLGQTNSDSGLGHVPQGVGARHYNAIRDELVRQYNWQLDEALEDAFRKTTGYVPFVHNHVKCGS